MEIIRDYENHTFCLMDGTKKLLETGYVGGEFILYFYSSKPIYITKDIDECFYNEFLELLNNEYTFNSELCKKINNSIIWLSDQYGDLENEKQTQKISRLIINKLEDKIEIKCINPFCEKNNIEKNMHLISFSPSGNGKFSKNRETDLTFQDDFIIMCNNILNNNKNKKLIRKI